MSTETQLRPFLSRVISPESDLSLVVEVQNSVLENIEHILNSSQVPASLFRVAGSHVLPHASRSVVNFGIPAYVGGYDYSVYSSDFAESVRQSLLIHEPRLVGETLRVEVLDANPDHPLSGEVRFRIEAHISVLTSGNRMEVETIVQPFKAPQIDRTQVVFR